MGKITDCSSCGTKDSVCLRRITHMGGNACCSMCKITDTHNQGEFPVRETTVKVKIKLPDVVADFVQEILGVGSIEEFSQNGYIVSEIAGESEFECGAIVAELRQTLSTMTMDVISIDRMD